MKSTILFRVTMAVFISALFISFSSFNTTKAYATHPTVLLGYGYYDVDFSFAGLDFSGDRTISMGYVEFGQNDGRGVAYLNHEGRKMKVELQCLFEEFSEDGVSPGGAAYEGFYAVAGIVKKVKGFSESDAMFPKLFAPEAPNKYPEVGDWALIAFKLNEGGSWYHGDYDQVSLPFVFPPVAFGAPVSCDSLIDTMGPHGPPFSIIDLTYGDLTGNIRLR